MIATVSTRFEHELLKLISEERQRLIDIMVAGAAVTDYVTYREYVAELRALARYEDLCERAGENLAKD